MFSKTFNSEQMDQLLTKLGYVLVPSEGKQRVYENFQFDAIMLLPPQGKEKFARLEHLMTLRRIAVEKGIVEEAEFDRLLDNIQYQGEPIAA